MKYSWNGAEEGNGVWGRGFVRAWDLMRGRMGLVVIDIGF